MPTRAVAVAPAHVGVVLHHLAQLEDSVHQRLRARRAAGHVHVDRHELVGRHERVVVEHAHRAAAGAHRDRPLGLEHLVVEPADDGRHLDRHAPGEDDQVGLARRGAERLVPETRDVHARPGRLELLHRAAGQPEREREERVRARPRDRRVERRRQDALCARSARARRPRGAPAGWRPPAPRRAAAGAAFRCEPAAGEPVRIPVRAAARPERLALHLHSSAPRRHTYTKATNSSTMNTIVSSERVAAVGAQLDGDRVQEDHLDVEQDEQHRDQVEADPEAHPALHLRRQPALVGILLLRRRAARADERVERRERDAHDAAENRGRRSPVDSCAAPRAVISLLVAECYIVAIGSRSPR